MNNIEMNRLRVTYERIRTDSVKLKVNHILKGLNENCQHWYNDCVRDNFDKDYTAEDFIDELITNGCLNNRLAIALAYHRGFFDYETDD